MFTPEEITTRYAALMAIPKSQEPVTPNRFNCYQCAKCMVTIKTVDRHNGVTPMFQHCMRCEDGTMRSTFYKDIMPAEEPIQEWYRPSLEEVLLMNTGKPQDDAVIQHVVSGGLIPRLIVGKQYPRGKSYMQVSIQVELDDVKPGAMPMLGATKIMIKTSADMDRTQYQDAKGEISKEGYTALTSTLIEGLIGSIHGAHLAGHIDSAGHMHSIMRRLEDGFVRVCEIKTEDKNFNA